MERVIVQADLQDMVDLFLDHLKYIDEELAKSDLPIHRGVYLTQLRQRTEISITVLTEAREAKSDAKEWAPVVLQIIIELGRIVHLNADNLNL